MREKRHIVSIYIRILLFVDLDGDVEVIDYLSDDSTWVYSFQWEKDLDSVGFKLKDYITWTSYKIVLNSDTVVNYTGPVPEGGYAGWYGIYYKF